MCFGMFFLANEIILILSGIAFLPSVLSLQIMSVLPLVIGLSYLFGFQILAAVGKDKESAIVIACCVAVCIFSNIILVPKLAHNGAALAIVLTEVALTVLLYVFVKRHLSIAFDFSLIVKASVASLTIIPLYFIVQSYHSPFVVFLVVSFLFLLTYICIQLLVFKSGLAFDLIHFKKHSNGKDSIISSGHQ